MLANQSLLNQTVLESPLLASSYISPKHNKWKRGIVADLLLTALIDAFSILVIFLLMSFSSTGDILYISKSMELPKARLAEVLERNPIIKIEDGQLFVEGKIQTQEGLIATLLELRKGFQDTHPGQEYPGIVTIQADRKIKYEFLNQVVLAASHAGYSDIRFAVLMK